MAGFVPHSETLLWLEIRDTLLGENYVTQDMEKAVRLASMCNHPDARWLVSVCAGKEISTREKALQVFQAENDDRARCFSWFFGDQSDFGLLEQSRYSFASSVLAWKTELDVRFKHASVAAAAGERDGLYWLGRCHRDGEGCEMDPGKAMSFFQRACHLGDVFSMIAIGDMMPDSDPERWRWAGIAALKGNSLRFMLSFAEEVEKYIDGFGNRRSVFYIGRALVGQVDHVEKRIFKSKWFFEARLGVATFAVEFFQSQLAACRMAVDAWSVVGVRFGVVKDIRILIAKLIWEAREEANYLCEEAIEEAEK